LEKLPCCTTNKSGDRNGDPLNISNLLVACATRKKRRPVGGRAPSIPPMAWCVRQAPEQRNRSAAIPVSTWLSTTETRWATKQQASCFGFGFEATSFELATILTAAQVVSGNNKTPNLTKGGRFILKTAFDIGYFLLGGVFYNLAVWGFGVTPAPSSAVERAVGDP
jgi:hypothetical protein